MQEAANDYVNNVTINLLKILEITVEHLKLISVESGTAHDLTETLKRCVDFLWVLVQDESGCKEQEIVRNAMDIICEYLLDMDSDIWMRAFFDKCIDNLKRHKSVYPALYLMRETYQFEDIVHTLDKNEFIKHYFREIAHFKRCVEQRVGEQYICDEL